MLRKLFLILKKINFKSKSCNTVLIPEQNKFFVLYSKYVRTLHAFQIW